ncbi:hypothetical protein ABID58_006901 [Bradyrhizobium sp. S3.2.6]
MGCARSAIRAPEREIYCRGGILERLAELLLARMLTKVDDLYHEREALLVSRSAPNQ